MRKNGVKNIFTNILLTVSLGLSIVGGTFLMAGAKQRQLAKAYADGLLDGITFISTQSNQTASGIMDGKYLYSNAKLNYIDVKGLVYYVDYVSTPSHYTKNEDGGYQLTGNAYLYKVFNSPEETIRKETEDLDVYNSDCKYVVIPSYTADGKYSSTTLFINNQTVYDSLDFNDSHKVDGYSINDEYIFTSENDYYKIYRYPNVKAYITTDMGKTYYVKDGALYSDDLFSQAVPTDEYQYISSTNQFNISGVLYDVMLETTIKNTTYKVKNDIYMFVFNGTTYYYKNGYVYDSIKCNNAISRDYDIIYDYNIRINGSAYHGENSIERIVVNGITYHKLNLKDSTENSYTATTIVSPIKSVNYDKFYTYNETNNSITSLDEVLTLKMEVSKILIHSDLPSTGTVEEFVTVFDKNYYINNNNLYSEPYYIDIDKETDSFDKKITANTNNTITFTENIMLTGTNVSINGQNHTFSSVTINNQQYFADTTTNPAIDKVDGIYSAKTIDENNASNHITVNENNSNVSFTYSADLSKSTGPQGSSATIRLIPVKIQTSPDDNTGTTYYVVVNFPPDSSNNMKYMSTYNGEATSKTLYNVNGAAVATNGVINGYSFNILFARNDGQPLTDGNIISSDDTTITVTINFKQINNTDMYGYYFPISESETSKTYYIKANDTNNIYEITNEIYISLTGEGQTYYKVTTVENNNIIIHSNTVTTDASGFATILINAYVKVTESLKYVVDWDDPNNPTVHATFDTYLKEGENLQRFEYSTSDETRTYYISKDNRVKKVNKDIEEKTVTKDSEGKYVINSEFAINTLETNKIKTITYHTAQKETDTGPYFIKIKTHRYYINQATGDNIEEYNRTNLYIKNGAGYTAVTDGGWIGVVVSGYEVKITWAEYSPVYINRNTYYVNVTKTNDSKLYTMSGDGSTNNPYVATPIGEDTSNLYEYTFNGEPKSIVFKTDKSLNFEYAINRDTNKVIAKFNYQLTTTTLKILNIIDRTSIKSNYFTYDWRYYYYNNKVYTTYPSSGADFSSQHEMVDFDYSPIISAITIEGANYPVKSATFTTVMLNNKQYYVDTVNGKLYTSMTLGLEDKNAGNQLIYYSGEVISRFFEYKIDENKQIVTIFTGESLKMENESIKIVTGISPGSGENVNIDYSFDSDNQTYYYSKNKNKFYMQVGSETSTIPYNNLYYTLLQEQYNGIDYYIEKNSSTSLSPLAGSLNIQATIAKPASISGTFTFKYEYDTNTRTGTSYIERVSANEGKTEKIQIDSGNLVWAWKYATNNEATPNSGLPLRLNRFTIKDNETNKDIYYYFVKPDTTGRTEDFNISIPEVYQIERNAFVNILKSQYNSEDNTTNYFLPKYYVYFNDGSTNYYFDIFNRSDKTLYTIVDGAIKNSGKTYADYTVDMVGGTITNGTTTYELKIDNDHQSLIFDYGSKVEIGSTVKFIIDNEDGTKEIKEINHIPIRYISHDITNIDVDIEFENGYSFFYNDAFQFPTSITVNGTSLTQIDNKFSPENPGENNNGLDELLKEINNNAYSYRVVVKSINEGDGKGEVNHFFYTLIFKYNKQYYAIYCGEKEKPLTPKVYYIGDNLPKTIGNTVNYEQISSEPVKNHDIELSLVDSNTATTINLKGFKDFFIGTTGSGDGAVPTLYNTDTYYYYSTSTSNNNYFNIEYGGITYYVHKDDDNVYRLYYDPSYSVEAKQINFIFNITTNSVNNSTINYSSFDYLEANGSYYILNSSNGVFDRFEYGIHSVIPNMIEEKESYRIASQIYINAMSQNYTLNSNNGQQYDSTNQENLLKQAQYENGSTIMLQNYLKNIALQNTTSSSTTSASQEIENVYIQFNKKYKTGTNDVSTDQYVSYLMVQAFLKNSETAQYSSSTEGYYNSEYGIRIAINPVRNDDEVTYKTTPVANWYWYNYFDLKGIKAIIGEGKDNIAINDPSGLYTIVFNYSYHDKNGNESAGNEYIYRFYLSDDTNYIEYPTFNTSLTDKITETTTGSGAIRKTTTYKSIVSKSANPSNMEYYYNFQSFDVPAYVYNATRFNVGYNYKYNLDSHEITTDFTIENTSSITGKEQGVLKVYDNGVLSETYQMQLNASNRAIDYYKTANGRTLFWGSLYITSSGEFYLSLEDNVYYNSKNRSEYKNEIDYYANGRLIKEGAKNIPLTYYMVMLLNDLGEYTFKNVRLISAGADSLNKTSYIQYPYDVNNGGAPNALNGNKYGNLTDSDTMRFGRFDNNGLFIYDKQNDIETTTPSADTNGKLTIYGVKTTFKKNGTLIDFNKLDDNIYSDITPNTYFTAGNELKDLSETDNWTGINSGNPLKFSSENYYGVPLTNLQPIYFNYYADIVFSESKYIRFSDFTYETYDNGSLKNVTIINSTYTITAFTNKTSINKSGVYIVKIAYKNKYSTTTESQTQYFMFVIDNTAPNMEILVHNNRNDNGTVFISNTEVSSTSRYTNKNFFSVNHITPNYFQGDVKVTYRIYSYDGKTPLTSETDYTSGLIATREGRYVFTIRYGVNSLSYNSTYVIVDKSAPTGELYNVESQESDTGDISYKYTSKYNYYSFNSPKVFVSNRLKSGSGAPVYAKIKTISLSSYLNYAQALNNFEAITTNVMLYGGSSLFNDDTLNDSPTYNFKSPDINNTSITNGQILGMTDQTSIYIIKLYDSAGNESYYYYFYDTSNPYILYQDVNKAGSIPQKSLENNTTQNNTSVIWGNYKAIYVDTSEIGSNNLYTKFMEKIASNNTKYNGITTKIIDEKLYILVPIDNVVAKSTNKSTSENIYASTSITNNFANNAIIYTTKYKNSGNPLNNKDASWTVTGTTLTEMFGGDKRYYFYITDSLGNEITRVVIMNSSYAQESFIGSYDKDNSNKNLKGKSAQIEADKAYTVDKLDVKYLSLEEGIFKPKITYDYYDFSYDKYLTNSDEKDTSNTPYSDLAYDLTEGSLYKYSDGLYYECDDINEYTVKGQGVTWATLSGQSKRSFFIPGYPFSIISNNQEIECSTITEKNSENEMIDYKISDIINKQNQQSARGLYVFRRIYVYNATGEMIKQAEIDNASKDSELNVLSEDYAVRYYVFYIDRNQIIDLTFDGDTIDSVNSIGDLLSILLGKQQASEGEEFVDASKITSAILKTYEVNSSSDNQSQIDIVTSKLRVVTDFSVDKYATNEKLTNGLANYDKTLSNNLIGENFTITKNNNVFKYLISFESLNPSEIWIENNVVKKPDNLTKLLNGNYSFFKSGQFRLTITDNSAMDIFDENGNIESIGANKYQFNFEIAYKSPTGTFQTKSTDIAGTIVDLPTRANSTSLSATGKTVIYKNINKDYLQFTFSNVDSLTNPYEAQINPYKVKILKNGSTLLETKYTKSRDNTIISTFENSTIPKHVRKYTDVIKVKQETGLPTEYTFVIFDKKAEEEGLKLLSTHDENATYTVILEFIGSSADYTVPTVNGIENYFTTTFQISVDNIKPADNMENLASKDKNLNYYCLNKYGVVYTALSDVQKADLLKTYAFPVSCLTNDSILKFAEEVEHLDKNFINDELKEGKTAKAKEERARLVSKYSTLFHSTYNDSIAVYARKIDYDLTKYAENMSYLPDEEGDNKKIVFNKYDTTNYIEYNYSKNETTSPSFDYYGDNYLSFTELYDDKDANKLNQGYYELFEEDEAGNISRYLVYINDNTNVKYGVNYISTENSTNVDSNNRYYFKTNDGDIIYVNRLLVDKNTYTYPASDYLGRAITNVSVSANKDNVPVEAKYKDVVYSIYKIYEQPEYSFEYTTPDGSSTSTCFITQSYSGKDTQFHFSNNATPLPIIYNKWQSIYNSYDIPIPIELEVGGGTPNIKINGFKSYSFNDEQEALNLFRVSNIYPMVLSATNQTINANDNNNYIYTGNGKLAYIFDQFTTVNIYSATKSNNAYNYTLQKSLVANPFIQSSEDFYKHMTVVLQDIVRINSGIFSYKIEIVNRFYDNYNILIDLPDAKLALTYQSTDTELNVLLPDASTNVKLLEFSVQSFNNGVWETLVKDATGKYIISQNLDDYNEGLPATTYKFGLGSYKFIVKDNFNRELIEYKFVGNKDDSYTFDFASNKYLQNNNNYTTSNDMNITIDASLYQLKFGLKDCIKIGDDNYSIFDGMLGVFEGEKFVPIRYNKDEGSLGTNVKIGDYLYYYKGALYSDKLLITMVEFSNVEFNITQNFCYTSKTRSDGKTVFSLKPIIKGSKINEFVFTINWAVDPDNISTYTVKIDQNKPDVKLLSSSDANLTIQENGNYYREFQITWESDYNTNGYLTITKNAVSRTIEISAVDYYTVSELGGYTLKIVDEIGNEISYNFKMINSSNNYFSVFVNNNEIFESNYIRTATDGKIIKYYYYLKPVNQTDPEILVKPDTTKGISCTVKENLELSSGGGGIEVLDKVYEIKRQSIDHTICYVAVIGVNSTNALSNFVSGVMATEADGTIDEISNNNIASKYNFDQNYSKIRIRVNNSCLITGNQIYAMHYYNGNFVKTYTCENINDTNNSTFFIDIVATGVHTFDIRDSVGNSCELSITLIREVIFNVNGETPINNRFFNGKVNITIPNMPEYYSNNFMITAMYNGIKYSNDTSGDVKNINNIATIQSAINSYTFSNSGYYEVTIKANGLTTTGVSKEYVSTYSFTIVNANVAKMTFGFSSNYGFSIKRVMKNELDVTDKYPGDSMWISSGETDTAGLYTITLLGLNSLTNESEAFTFNIRINNETPAITPINYEYGTSTTKTVTLTYNSALIYSQVGESYIEVSCDGEVRGTIDIDADSIDELSTITIGDPGRWTITIYNKDGNFIASYTVNKAVPLNSSAKLIIIISVIVFVALVIAFIILRKHTKFR